MKKKVREILSKYRQNEGYTMEHAERELLDLFSVSERYILVEWLNEIPLVDGSLYFDSKEDLLEYHKKQPRVEGVTHTICRIRNAR